MSFAAAYAKKKGEGCPMCAGGQCKAHGGMMMEQGMDRVSRVMQKRMSMGGRVANDTQPMADDEPAEYDDLVLRDDLESSYTGKNSGDYLSDEQEDMDRKDIVSRVMRSRKFKDKMPRPA